MDLNNLIENASLTELTALRAQIDDEIRKKQMLGLPNRSLKTFTDGASRGNPGPAGAGLLIFDEEDQKIFEDCQYLGETTNNEAEYRALILALDRAHKFTQGPLSCFMDSQLLARQLNGEYAMKSEKLQVFFNQIQEKKKMFSEITFNHVPRETPNLQLADRLANKAIDQARMKK